SRSPLSLPLSTWPMETPDPHAGAAANGQDAEASDQAPRLAAGAGASLGGAGAPAGAGAGDCGDDDDARTVSSSSSESVRLEAAWARRQGDGGSGGGSGAEEAAELRRAPADAPAGAAGASAGVGGAAAAGVSVGTGGSASSASLGGPTGALRLVARAAVPAAPAAPARAGRGGAEGESAGAPLLSFYLGPNTESDLGASFRQSDRGPWPVAGLVEGGWAQRNGVHVQDQLCRVNNRDMEGLLQPEVLAALAARPLMLSFARSLEGGRQLTAGALRVHAAAQQRHERQRVPGEALGGNVRGGEASTPNLRRAQTWIKGAWISDG
ncbi:unnamed protein product, partial [Prorocentrum cordatum]